MVTIYWLDITDHTVIKLSLSGRIIYSAAIDDVNKPVPLSELKGRIISPMSQDIIKIQHWIIYETREGDVRIAPIYPDLVEEVKSKRHIFESPVDIRAVYDVLSL